MADCEDNLKPTGMQLQKSLDKLANMVQAIAARDPELLAKLNSKYSFTETCGEVGASIRDLFREIGAHFGEPIK